MQLDKWQAIHSFWSSFNLTAYDEASVPDGAQLPYITYTADIDSLDNTIILNADVWYQSHSWEEISNKVDEIDAQLSNNGVRIQCDEGYLWIVRGSPFAQRINEENSEIKRIYVNTLAEFLTN